MGKYLTVTIVVIACIILYSKILNKLDIKEKTRQIAILIPNAIIVIFLLVCNIILGSYPSDWIFFLYACLGLIGGILKLYNKEELAKKFDKWGNIIFWSSLIAWFVEGIM